MARTLTFRFSLNQVSLALADASRLDELRYLDKLQLLGNEHRDLEASIFSSVNKLDRAVKALPEHVAGGDTWPSIREDIVHDLGRFLTAYNACDFERACFHVRMMRDGVAVGRSYLREHEGTTAPAKSIPASWSLDELAEDLRANGIGSTETVIRDEREETHSSRARRACLPGRRDLRP